MASNFQRFTSSYGNRRFATCYCWTQTASVENAVRHAVTADSGELRSFVLPEKKRERKGSIAAPTKRDFCDSCRSRGHFRYDVNRAKRFVNVNLDCVISNPEKVLRTPMVPSQRWLTAWTKRTCKCAQIYFHGWLWTVTHQTSSEKEPAVEWPEFMRFITNLFFPLLWYITAVIELYRPLRRCRIWRVRCMSPYTAFHIYKYVL